MSEFRWRKRLGAIVLTFAVSTTGAFARHFSSRRSLAFLSPQKAGVEIRQSVPACDSIEWRTLYPPVEPSLNGTLAVDKTHTLFYQEYGTTSESALTALFLHGGPGAGCSPNHARFFDPTQYRIILLDQRGSGKSSPPGQVHINNTLEHLVHDCDTLRQALEIKRWDVVLGGSWGSTLAIAYAQTFPNRVRSLVLRGVCLLRPAEVDWLTNRNGGAAASNWDGWRNFSRAVGIDPLMDTGRDALHAHYDRLLCDDPGTRWKAAVSWMRWEMSVGVVARRLAEDKRNTTEEGLVLAWNPVTGWGYQDSMGNRLSVARRFEAIEESRSLRRGIMPTNIPAQLQLYPRPVYPIPRVVPSSSTESEEVVPFVPAQAMLTCYYSVNSRYALNNVDFLSHERISRIRNISCIAVQGGMDMICPPDTALDLHEVWPEMELRIPTASGHSMYDGAITNELIKATDQLARVLSDQV